VALRLTYALRRSFVAPGGVNPGLLFSQLHFVDFPGISFFALS
jgi:hypothetical protein